MSMKRRVLKRPSRGTVASALGLLLASGALLSTLSSDNLHARWYAEIYTSSNTMPTSSATLTKQSGSGPSSGAINTPGDVSSTFDDGVLNSLVKNGTAAGVDRLALTQGKDVKVTYEFKNPTVTGIFAEDATMVKAFITPTAAACTTAAVPGGANGPILYEGVLRDMSITPQTSAAPAQDAVTNIYLCSVITVPSKLKAYEQVATVTADAENDSTSATSVWMAQIDTPRTATGTLTYNTTWSFGR